MSNAEKYGTGLSKMVGLGASGPTRILKKRK